MKKKKLAQRIIKILIESGLSISEQLKVIKNVKEWLDFCRTTVVQMNQKELF